MQNDPDGGAQILGSCSTIIKMIFFEHTMMAFANRLPFFFIHLVTFFAI